MTSTLLQKEWDFRLLVEIPEAGVGPSHELHVVSERVGSIRHLIGILAGPSHCVYLHRSTQHRKLQICIIQAWRALDSEIAGLIQWKPYVLYVTRNYCLILLLLSANYSLLTSNYWKQLLTTTTTIITIRRVRWDRVHLVRRPLVWSLYQPRMMMSTE
jgi:hypothetical protein